MAINECMLVTMMVGCDGDGDGDGDGGDEMQLVWRID